MEQLNEFLAEWQGDELFIRAHTSGSTGKPKEISLLKTDMLLSAHNTNTFFGIGSHSVLGLPLSIDYIAGKMMVVRSLLAKCSLRLFPVSNTFEVDEHIDLLSVVPSQVASLIRDADSLRNVSNLLIGGAALDSNLEHEIIKAGVNAYIGYGMTETCSHIALRRLGDLSKAYSAMPGIRFSTDNRGCLVIHSSDFSWKSIVTNDIVELLNDTSFVWRGRFDNVINSGGIKLHPEEIEKRLSTIIDNPFYIVGHPSDKWGECVALVVEGGQADLHMIEGRLAHLYLPKGWKPTIVVGVESLPKTANGKIKRIAIAELNRTC